MMVQVVFYDRGANSRIGFASSVNCYTGSATTAGIDVFATGSRPHPRTVTLLALAAAALVVALCL
jgi:hypothetical protein